MKAPWFLPPSWPADWIESPPGRLRAPTGIIIGCLHDFAVELRGPDYFFELSWPITGPSATTAHGYVITTYESDGEHLDGMGWGYWSALRDALTGSVAPIHLIQPLATAIRVLANEECHASKETI